MTQSETDALARYLCDELEEIPRHERNSPRALAIFSEMEKLVAAVDASSRPKARSNDAATAAAMRISRKANPFGLNDEEREYADRVRSRSRFPLPGRFRRQSLPARSRGSEAEQITATRQALVELGARGAVNKLAMFGHRELARRLQRAAYESRPNEFSLSVLSEIETHVREALGKIDRRG